MWCKLLLVALLGVTLVQSYVPEDPQDQLFDNEAPVLLAGAFSRFKAVIDKAIAKTKAVLHNLKLKLEQEVAAMVGHLKGKLQVEVAKLLKELKALEDEAKRKGIDIKVCMKDRKQQIINLPKSFGREIVKCGIDEVNRGVGIINSGLAEVERSIHQEEALTKEWKLCGNLKGGKKAACYTRVTAKMSVAAAKIPITLVRYEQKAQKYVQNIKKDLEACALVKVAQAAIRGGVIVKEVAKCVHSKRVFGITI